MNQISLKTIKSKKNKWWMKMHFLFSLLIVSQYYVFDHQIEHLNDFNDTECVQCIVSTDYFDSTSNSVIINDALPDSVFKLNIGQSVAKNPPGFYSSRAPPTII